MAISYRRPNGNGATAEWQDTYTAVDEGYENRDGTGGGEQIEAINKGDIEIHTVQDADWSTSDYVKSVMMRCSCFTSGSGTDELDLSISGDSTNWTATALRFNASTTFKGYGARAYTTNLRDLGTNYNTTFNGLELEAQADQRGMGTALGHTITAWDLAVEYFPASPAKGDLAWYAEGGNTGIASIAVTFPGSHTAKANNILILAFSNNSSSVPTPSGTGWTSLQSGTVAGSSRSWYVWWKEADGGETGYTVNGTGNFTQCTLMLYEIEWSGGTPTLQSNVNTTDEDTTVTTHTSTGITPTNGSDNVVLGLFQVHNLLNWTFGLHLSDTDLQNGWDLYATIPGAGSPAIPSTALTFTCAHKKNVSGSQSLTWQTESTNEDAGDSVVSVMVVINAAAAGGANELDFERGASRGIARGIGRGT